MKRFLFFGLLGLTLCQRAVAGDNKKEVLTLSNGKYVETFDQDSVEVIGNILYNVNSRQIVGFIDQEPETTETAMQPEVISRWLSIDPLAAKYPSISPYAFATNNPIRYIDPDGREIVDANKKHVTITTNKDGTLSFSKNATTSIIRIANALNLTDEGRKQLNNLMGSKIKVQMEISPDAKIRKTPKGTAYQSGATVQGNYDAADNYGKFQAPDGKFGIKEAKITIYEGTIKEEIKAGSGMSHEGLTQEQAIGAVAGHEAVHAVDEVEINKDIQYEQTHGGNPRPDSQREAKPENVEQKIIDQSK